MSSFSIESATQLLRNSSRREFLCGAVKIGTAGTLTSVAAPLLMTPSRAVAAGTFKLGWIRPTTGRIAASFAPAYIGGLIAVQEINASGGINGRQIELLEEDDEASPAKQPAIVTKLKQAGVRYVIGPTGSSQALASAMLTSEARMIQATYGVAATAGDGFKYPYHYQASINSDIQAAVVVDYMVRQLKLRKIGILRENTAYGEEITKATMMALMKQGLMPTAIESHPVPVTSMDANVAKLKASGAEGVIVWEGTIPAIAMSLNTMNNLKWRPPVAGHSSLLNESFLDLVSAEALENVVATHYKKLTWSDSESPGARQLEYARKISAFPEAKNLGAIVAASPYYDFIHLLRTVIEKEKSFDADIVKSALDKVSNYSGMIGNMSFSKGGHTAFGPQEIAMASVSSARDPKARGIFRKKV